MTLTRTQTQMEMLELARGGGGVLAQIVSADNRFADTPLCCVRRPSGLTTDGALYLLKRYSGIIWNLGRFVGSLGKSFGWILLPRVKA